MVTAYRRLTNALIRLARQSGRLSGTGEILSTDYLADLVKGGTFTMGCTKEQKDCEKNEKARHQVTLSDFYIGKYEVTQRQWQQVMGGNPSGFIDCDDCPVEYVSWDDVQAFLKKLNAGLPAGQKPYRLPTEAEWEYAARGGGKAVLFGNGKNVADPKEINFNASDSYKTSYSVAGDYRQKTVSVGSLNSPNALGLHDMSGNVWEWCSDWFGTYSSGAQTNPTGSSTGSYRVLRGGSWYDLARLARMAVRGGNRPDYRVNYAGFRLARSK
ncbi:MAG: formylglycine-generating enzyme family protein [Saprospiraceae bacterium]